MYFLDLEDSVAPEEKEVARAKVVDAIRAQDWGEAVLCVRVNGWDSRWTYRDVIEVVSGAGGRLDELMLPKVERRDEVVALDLLLGQVERNTGLPVGHLGIEAQIESARGLINVEEICASSPRLEAVIFGPVDFSASVGMPSLEGGLPVAEYPGDHFHYVFMKLLVAARANGLQVIDGPYVRAHDLDGLKKYAKRSQVLGFDGKWTVHPTQISVCNEIYTPIQADYERARTLIARHRTAAAEGSGAFLMGEDMIDEASRKAALSLIARAERAGLTAPSNG